MPDWMITIGREREFTPNPRKALGGDVIYWRNDDSEPHWPAPYLMGTTQPDKYGYMNYQIPPGATSDTAFSPAPVPDDGPDYIEIQYCCALHPEEKGIIRVLRAPPALPQKGEVS